MGKSGNSGTMVHGDNMGRTLLIVDGKGVHTDVRYHNESVDYGRLRNAIAEDFDLVRSAFFDVTIEENDGTIQTQNLLDWLTFNQWQVYTKPSRTYTPPSTQQSSSTNSWSTQQKALNDMSVEIALYMAEACSISAGGRVEHIILMTNDDDLAAALAHVASRQVTTTLISTKKESGRGATALNRLRRASDHFVDVKELLPRIRRLERSETEAA